MADEFVTPIPVMSCAVLRDGHILLLKRAIEPGIGKWAFPAGHLEPGETIEQGMAREVKEETGLDLEVVYRCSFARLIDAHKAYISLIFVARADQEHVVIDEESMEWRWVRLDRADLDALDWAFPKHRVVALELADSDPS